ncbi:MAG: hypothetical protein HRS50_01545 [Mycoplasmataceae bacterium]|nr:hypothetical protein [Mycoplasmataceae bacterium]
MEENNLKEVNNKIKEGVKPKRLSESLKKSRHQDWDKEIFNEFYDSELEKNEQFKSIIKSQPFDFYSVLNSNFKEASDSNVVRTKEYFVRNIIVVGTTMIKNFLTNGTGIWFLLVTTLLSVLLINNFTSIHWMEFPLDINFGGYNIVINVDQPIVFTNYSNFNSAFVTPMLSLTVLFIPAFVVTIRNDSTIKRLGVYGVSKEQLNIGITLTAILIVLSAGIIIYWPILWMGKLTTSLILGGYNINWLFPFNQTPDWEMLLILLIVSTAAFTQIGIFVGTKFNQTKTTIFIGFVFMFFSNFTMYAQGGLPAVPLNFSIEGSTSLETAYNTFRWLFFISPYTLFLQAISLTAVNQDFIRGITQGFSIENGISWLLFHNESTFISPPFGIILRNTSWNNWLIPLSLCVGMIITFVPMWYSDKWIRLEGIR